MGVFHERSRHWIMGAVTCTMLLVTTACSGGLGGNRASNGPVSVGSEDEVSHLCTPGVRSSDIMYTANSVQNRGDEDAVLTSVS